MNVPNATLIFETPAALIDTCAERGGVLYGQFPGEEDRRILLASHELGLDGAPIALLSMARSLRRLGWQPVLISPAAGPLLDTLKNESFPVLICPSVLENDVLPRSIGLFRFIVLNTLAFAQIAAVLNGSSRSILWWIHEADEVYQKYTHIMPDHLFSNLMVYTGSPQSREHLLRHCPNYFAGVLTCGIPDVTEKVAESFPISPKAEGKHIFALIGAVERRKGQDVLLDAVRHLPEDVVHQCFFVFAGPVFQTDIGEQVRMAASDQADRFQYIPQIPLEMKPAFFAGIDCVICASRDDPEPITVVEGCIFSKAVICSEHTGMASLLEQDSAGYVYGGDDPAELAHCIVQVLGQSTEEAGAMQERARSSCLSHFSLSKFDERLETEILPELLTPDWLSEKPDAQSPLLRLLENSRQKRLQLEMQQKQELEKMIELEQSISEKQVRISQLEGQNQALIEAVKTCQAHIHSLDERNQKLIEQVKTHQTRIDFLEKQKQNHIEQIKMHQVRTAQLEEQNRNLSENPDNSSNDFLWKITIPIRFFLDILKWMIRRHSEKGLLRKGLYSLRTNGFHVTWQKAMNKIFCGESSIQESKQALFTRKELARQRRHCFSEPVKFSIVVPLYNTPECFLREMIESVQRQTYANWELCMADGSDMQHVDVSRICKEYANRDKRIRYRKLEKNFGISGNTNACLEMVEGDYIGLFDHDDQLHPAALYEVMRTIENTGADFIYTDESLFHDSPEDAYAPHFKPDFAPDNLRAINYICHFTVLKRTLLDEAGLFDPACEGSQDHDMVLRLTEKAQRIAHIPEILYYWRAHKTSVADDIQAKPYVIQAGIHAVEKQLERLGLKGTVKPVQPGLSIYRIRYTVTGRPKVSILIPNYENIKQLRTCLDSIFTKTTWTNYEIVIVDNNSKSPELFNYYERLRREHVNVRVIIWKGRFNYSAINNYGAQFCTGDYLLLLNNETEVITSEWIEEMLMFAQRKDVGAVGAMLYYPDRTIQHAGVCLGLGGVAGHYSKHMEQGNTGYMGRLLYSQNMSAVRGSCMLLRREVWDEAVGLNEYWSLAFNDVDLCMRIRKAGYLIVWTPYAELIRHEPQIRDDEDTPEKKKRFRAEAIRFQSEWAKELEAGDPYYNPNFTLDIPDFIVKPTVQQYDARYC